MNVKVSNLNKRYFINMLLTKYKFKTRESEEILLYLLTDDILLNNTHFVDNITKCSRAISLSTTCVANKPFSFYKANINNTNGLQAYHDLRLNNKEPLYIKVNFSDRYNLLYQTVLEKNPHLISYESQENIRDDLDSLLFKQQQHNIRHQIDLALDKNDKEQFISLSNKLNNLMNEFYHSDL